ncbi:MAG: NACHT domain-containing protein [Pseudonocardia sp.]
MLRRLADRVGLTNLFVVVLSALFLTWNAITNGLEGANQGGLFSDLDRRRISAAQPRSYKIHTTLLNNPQGSSIVAAILALLALITPPRKLEYKTVNQVTDQISEQVRNFWKGEARKRNLDELRFIPPKIEVLAGPDFVAATQQYLASLPTQNYWSLVDMRRVCAAAVHQFESVRRVIVYGEPGTGKSTVAVALTLGLIDRLEFGGRLIPLTLSLSSWDVREEFATWLNRRLEDTYPSVRLTSGESPRGRAGNLMSSGRFIFILDGLDELPKASISQAVADIDKFFFRDQHLCLLTRQASSLHVLQGAMHLRLAISDISSVHAYLTSLSEESSINELSQISREILVDPGGNLADMLRRPLYLILVCQSLASGHITSTKIIETTKTDVASVKAMLFSAVIDRALQSTQFLRHARARSWLVYFGGELHARNVQAFAWWRIGDAVPRLLMICTVTMTVVPSYALGLLMPVGLTRGLTVGVMAGIILGVLRGCRVKPADVLAPFVLSWTLVFATGVSWVGTDQSAVDATEISLSIALCLILKDRLLLEQLGVRVSDEGTRVVANFLQFVRAWSLLFIVVLGGIVVSVATYSVGAVLDFFDPNRGILSNSDSVVFGLGVAAVACRLHVRSRSRMQPSRVQLRLARRLGGSLPPLWSGIMTTALIGIVGGVSGGFRFGQQYGVSLFLIFGVVIGVPVGIAGGVMNWLNSPTVIGGTSTFGSTLKSDRVVAIGSIAGLSVAGSVSILLFYGYLRGPVAVIQSVTRFELQITQGVLLGLTLGIVLACCNTAWPAYFIGHLWLVILGVLPWRMEKFLRELHDTEILRQEGAIYMFRHLELQLFLAAEYSSQPT